MVLGILYKDHRSWSNGVREKEKIQRDFLLLVYFGGLNPNKILVLGSLYKDHRSWSNGVRERKDSKR